MPLAFWIQFPNTLPCLSPLFCHPLLILKTLSHMPQKALFHSSLILLFSITFPPPQFLSSPTTTAFLPSLCSLFAIAQMAGAAEQGQRGRKRDRERESKKTPVYPKQVIKTDINSSCDRPPPKATEGAEREMTGSCEKPFVPRPSGRKRFLNACEAAKYGQLA